MGDCDETGAGAVRDRRGGWNFRNGATLLSVRFRHVDELSVLPTHGDHRDPFDRMLIAQALAEELSMVSSDTRFEDYTRLRLIWQ